MLRVAPFFDSQCSYNCNVDVLLSLNVRKLVHWMDCCARVASYRQFKTCS